MIFTSFYKLIFYFQQNGGKLISVDYIYNKVKLRNNHFNCRYVVKPLPKLGTAADPFRFMDAHCWDFTK